MRYGDERRFHVLAGKLGELSPVKDLKPKQKADQYAILLEYDLVKFAYAVAQTRSHAGFDMPVVTDTPRQIMDIFETLDNLPASFVNDWFDAAEALRAPVDKDLGPAETLSKGQKKVAASASDA